MIEKLAKLADEYINDAGSCANDQQATQWGLEIMLADFLQLAHESKLNIRDLIGQGKDLHEQRADEGIYDHRPTDAKGR